MSGSEPEAMASQPTQNMTDIERIADLCLNYKSPQTRLNEIADNMRILEIEVKLLLQRLDSAEQQNQQYKKAIEAL